MSTIPTRIVWISRIGFGIGRTHIDMPVYVPAAWTEWRLGPLVLIDCGRWVRRLRVDRS